MLSNYKLDSMRTLKGSVPRGVPRKEPTFQVSFFRGERGWIELERYPDGIQTTLSPYEGIMSGIDLRYSSGTETELSNFL